MKPGRRCLTDTTAPRPTAGGAGALRERAHDARRRFEVGQTARGMRRNVHDLAPGGPGPRPTARRAGCARPERVERRADRGGAPRPPLARVRRGVQARAGRRASAKRRRTAPGRNPPRARRADRHPPRGDPRAAFRASSRRFERQVARVAGDGSGTERPLSPRPPPRPPPRGSRRSAGGRELQLGVARRRRVPPFLQCTRARAARSRRAGGIGGPRRRSIHLDEAREIVNAARHAQARARAQLLERRRPGPCPRGGRGPRPWQCSPGRVGRHVPRDPSQRGRRLVKARASRLLERCAVRSSRWSCSRRRWPARKSRAPGASWAGCASPERRPGRARRSPRPSTRRRDGTEDPRRVAARGPRRAAWRTRSSSCEASRPARRAEPPEALVDNARCRFVPARAGGDAGPERARADLGPDPATTPIPCWSRSRGLGREPRARRSRADDGPDAPSCGRAPPTRRGTRSPRLRRAPLDARLARGPRPSARRRDRAPTGARDRHRAPGLSYTASAVLARGLPGPYRTHPPGARVPTAGGSFQRAIFAPCGPYIGRPNHSESRNSPPTHRAARPPGRA